MAEQKAEFLKPEVRDEWFSPEGWKEGEGEAVATKPKEQRRPSDPPQPKAPPVTP